MDVFELLSVMCEPAECVTEAPDTGTASIISCSIQGIAFEALLDSGATITVVNEKWIQEHFPSIKYVYDDNERNSGFIPSVKGINGESKPMGCVKLHFEFSDPAAKMTVPTFVLEGENLTHPIIGTNVIGVLLAELKLSKPTGKRCEVCTSPERTARALTDADSPDADSPDADPQDANPPDAESLAPTRPPEVIEASVSEPTRSEPPWDALPRTERNKLSVEMLAEVLVSRVIKKARACRIIENPEAVARRLFQRMWAEVEEVDFDVTEKIFKNLGKSVHRDLCRTWGGADAVLLLVRAENPELEDGIASSVRDHLMTPPKAVSTIGRFLSSVGEAASKTFRRGGLR